MTPKIIDQLGTVDPNLPDDFFILSGSWEERCIGVAQRTKSYKSSNILINVYDSYSKTKKEYLEKLDQLLSPKGIIKHLNSKQSNPIEGIKRMLHYIKDNYSGTDPRISFDISCFTRKHLLQLLNCLECNGLLGNTNFYYSQPTDYYIENNRSNAEGILSISEIETFSGINLSSKDTALILFLNFEGRRAIALWQELQPHVTLPIIPFPAVKKEWEQKLQDQNKLLLSTLNLKWEDIGKVEPLNANATKEFLIHLTNIEDGNEIFKHNNYNYIIGPLGTKPQVLGIFRYCRLFPNKVSIVYPSPIQYKDIPNSSFPTECTYLIDKSINWEKISH